MSSARTGPSRLRPLPLDVQLAVAAPLLGAMVAGGVLLTALGLLLLGHRLAAMVLVAAAAGLALAVAVRPAAAGVLLPLLVLEALSFTRSTWVPLLLAYVALPALVSSRQCVVVLTERVIVVVVMIGAVLILALSGSLGGTGVVVAERLLSTTGSASLAESSLLDRQKENAATLTAASQAAVAGVGLNLAHGPEVYSYDAVTNTTSSEQQRYVHNSFLGVWLWLGLPGVAAVLWLSWRIARTCFEAAARVGWRAAFTPVAVGSGLMVLAVQSTFQTNLLYAPALAAFGAGLAYLDTWWDTAP